MRFNDRELVKFVETKPDYEGILQHMKPQNKDWSDWYQPPSFKERYFKLKGNVLCYYRVNELEPNGVLVLENAQIAYEHRTIPFAFSITFKVNDMVRDNESKHMFSCRCESDVSKWVDVLKMASYEYWRSQYYILKTKISMKTGLDPVLDFNQTKTSEDPVKSSSSKKWKDRKKSATFYGNLEAAAPMTPPVVPARRAPTLPTKEPNLIEL